MVPLHEADLSFLTGGDRDDSKIFLLQAAFRSLNNFFALVREPLGGDPNHLLSATVRDFFNSTGDSGNAGGSGPVNSSGSAGLAQDSATSSIVTGELLPMLPPAHKTGKSSGGRDKDKDIMSKSDLGHWARGSGLGLGLGLGRVAGVSDERDRDRGTTTGVEMELARKLALSQDELKRTRLRMQVLEMVQVRRPISSADVSAQRTTESSGGLCIPIDSLPSVCIGRVCVRVCVWVWVYCAHNDVCLFVALGRWQMGKTLVASW